MTPLDKIQDTVREELIRDYPEACESELKSLLVLGLTEESGEVAGLRKRNLRNNFRDKGRGGKDEYIDELGDVLWYLAACCWAFDTSLEEIWQYNRKKLEKRYGNVNSKTVGTTG